MNIDFEKDNYRFNARAAAIKREIKEKLGYTIDFKLISIQENFAEKDNKKIMQYCFCYKGIYNENIKENRLKCNDNDNQYFYWINMDKINDYKIYPKLVYELINEENLNHIIEK